MGENTSRETLESANENNRPKSQQKISAETFLRHFATDYLDKQDQNTKNELMEEAMSKEELTGTKLLKALQEFQDSDDGNTYSEIKISELRMSQVKRQFAKGFMQTKKVKQDLQTKVLQQYNIEVTEYETKIAPALKKKSLEEVQRLLRSEQKLALFLKQQLKKDPQVRVKFDLLAGISQAQMQDRVRKMKPDKQKEIAAILLSIQNGKVPNDIEIRTLLESSLFDETQKIRFVHQFAPIITLQKALDIGLIAAGKAEQIKQNYIRDALAEKQLSSENTTKISGILEYKDIQIATQDVVISAADAVKISEGVGFEDLVSDLEDQKQAKLETLRSAGPKTFEGLQTALAGLGEEKVKNALLFTPGNTIQVSKHVSGEQDIHYVKITQYNDVKKEFSFLPLGGKKLNGGMESESQNIGYEDFFHKISQDRSTSLSAMTQQMLEEKIRNKEIQTSELDLYSPQDLEGPEKSEKRKEIQAKEIQALQEELTQAKEKLAKEENANNTAVVASLEREIGEAQEGEYDISKLTSLANKFALLEKIDEIDTQGTGLGLGNNTGQKVAFYTGKGENTNTYTIQKVDYIAWTITLYSRAGLQKDMSLDTFYAGFKEQNPKRVKAVDSESQLVAGFGENFEFTDGEIIQKNAELNGEKVTDKRAHIEYMKNDKGDLIKIVSLSNGWVEFQEGTIVDGEDDHDHKAHAEERKKGKEKIKKDDHSHHSGPKEKKYNLKIKGARVQKWTLDEFHRYINGGYEKEKFTADWKIGQQRIEEHPLKEQNKTHGSMIDRIFKGMSIYEIIHGGGMVLEGIKESLEHGSHSKSAHAALMISKFLPEELRVDMQIKVEAAEAEDMEKQYKNLGNIDSKPAAKRIRSWLKNRDTPSYKIEAATLYMMSKYGHLTSKGPLADLRGKWMWYERLGGRVNDELFLQVQKDSKGQSFNEERLVYALLNKQCKEEHGYNGIHRRTRIYKEYENNWKKGVEEEYDKGYKDASKYMTAEAMMKGGLEELEGGTTSNAFGWAKKVCEKGGSLEDMTAIPFVAMFSGAIFNIDQTSYTEVKKLWDKGTPITAFYMMKSTKHMKLYNATVLRLSEKIERSYGGKYAGMYQEAKEILESVESKSGDEISRIKRTRNFWDKYGKVLARSLSMTLESDNEFAKTDRIINQEKDIPPFDEYYSIIRHASTEADAFGKDFMDDAFGENGVSGMNPYQLTKKYLKLGPDRVFYEKSIAPKIWDGFSGMIKSTPKKLLIGNDINSFENRNAQKNAIAEILQDIVAGFYELGSADFVFNAFNSGSSDVGQDMNNWGLDLRNDLGLVSSRDILAGKYNRVFMRVAENIISGKGGNTSSVEIPDVFNIRQKVQTGVAANLSEGPQREYKNAA